MTAAGWAGARVGGAGAGGAGVVPAREVAIWSAVQARRGDSRGGGGGTGGAGPAAFGRAQPIFNTKVLVSRRVPAQSRSQPTARLTAGAECARSAVYAVNPYTIDSAPSSPGLLLALARLALAQPGWTCSELSFPGDEQVQARFEKPGTADWVRVAFAHPGAFARPFRRLPTCDVRYECQLRQRNESERDELASLIASAALTMSAALDGGATISSALRRRADVTPLEMSADALLDRVGLSRGAAAFDCWMLADAYSSEEVWSARDDRGVVFDFVAEDETRALVVVRAGGPEIPLTASLTMNSAADPLLQVALLAWVRGLLAATVPAGTAFTFPSAVVATSRGTDGRVESPAGFDALKIVVSSPCGQSCEFCSIQNTFAPEDGEERELARLVAELEGGARMGIRALRVTGLDPLRFTRILEVFRISRALGFQRVDLHSPATRLADAAFCDALLERMPPERRFMVPLYGAESFIHDAVVGRVGAFDDVMTGLDNLLARVTPSAVSIVSVCTATALESQAEISAHAAARGVSFFSQLAFPDLDSRADKYFAVAPRQIEVARVIARSPHLAAQIAGVAPCVLHRALAEADTPAATEMRLQLMKGTVRSPVQHGARTGHVACPHFASCPLAPQCPGNILRAYSRLHGFTEFVPPAEGERASCV